VRRDCGFTLLEVLIALAVLAIGMLAVIGAAGSSTRIDSQLRDKTFATWVAMNELTTLRLARSWPTDTQNDDADMGGQKWHWVAKFTPTSDPDLLRVDVSVSNAQQPDQEIASVTGFMGNPVTGGAPPPLTPGGQPPTMTPAPHT